MTVGYDRTATVLLAPPPVHDEESAARRHASGCAAAAVDVSPPRYGRPAGDSDGTGRGGHGRRACASAQYVYERNGFA